MTEQSFGGVWTSQKLEVIESYLKFYTTVLKNQKFKLCYIDAFAGSGTVTLNNGEVLDGSAIRALQYPFKRFRFFEKNPKHYALLKERVDREFPHLDVKIYNTDCKEQLDKINDFNWLNKGWRGVVFLDPYALDLPWSCLEKISNTHAFDVWYLFPFSAVNRNLYKDGKIPEANKRKVTEILGTTDWEDDIYHASNQLSLWGDNKEKIDTDGLREYILQRLQNTFYTTSKKAAILRNEKNSPFFLLCFAGSNPNPKASSLSLKAADHLLDRI